MRTVLRNAIIHHLTVMNEDCVAALENAQDAQRVVTSAERVFYRDMNIAHTWREIQLQGEIAVPVSPAPPPEDGPRRLYINGQWYSLALEYDQNATTQTEQIAQASIAYRAADFQAAMRQVNRLKMELTATIEALRTQAAPPPPIMTRAHAEAGLRLWRDDANPNFYWLSKSLQYFPQRANCNGVLMPLVPDQFRPQLVLGVVRWAWPSGSLHIFQLRSLRTGQRLRHYHSLQDSDCVDALERAQAKNYEEVLAVYAKWEQQLQIINFDSIGNETPPDLPRRLDIRIQEKEVFGWTHETVSSSSVSQPSA